MKAQTSDTFWVLVSYLSCAAGGGAFEGPHCYPTNAALVVPALQETTHPALGKTQAAAGTSQALGRKAAQK